MAYLVTHMAACLVFAQLLGLILGWLLWGHVARQRGQELRLLRERPLDVANSRRLSFAEPAPALADAGIELPNTLLSRSASDSLPPLAADLQAEIQQERKKNFDKQARELESLRGLISSLQTDLGKAVEGRRTAEQSLAETKSKLESRADKLQAQIREFEDAAHGWEEARRHFELDGFSKDKELSAARAQLRDVLNSQQPLSANAEALAPFGSTDLGARLNHTQMERDALRGELDSLKASIATRPAEPPKISVRIVELEETLREKEAALQEQAARVESLLWRVAELEPFAANAPRLEESMRRQGLEISGHTAIHDEISANLRLSQVRVLALEAELSGARKLIEEKDAEAVLLSQSITEAQATANEARATAANSTISQVAELDSLKLKLKTSTDQMEDLRSSSATKDKELAEHRNDVANHVRARAELERRLAELQRKITVLVDQDQLIVSRNNEIKALLSANADTEREKREWREKAGQLEQRLVENGREFESLTKSHSHAAEQLAAAEKNLDALRTQLNRLPELEKQVDDVRQAANGELQSLKARHQTDLQRLKIASSQRIRRLRQGIANFS